MDEAEKEIETSEIEEQRTVAASHKNNDSSAFEEQIENRSISEDEAKTPTDSTTFKNETYDWLESILVAIISIVFIFTFFVRVNTVSGNSMVPTLQSGEKLLVSDLFYAPAYNDIVIIQAKDLVNDYGEMGKPIVKRIIGLPGDKIRIDFENGIVYRNNVALLIETASDGKLIEDGHLINAKTTRALDMTGEVVVPEDSYFVMGDNRRESKDSRDNEIGFVERNYIVGKAFFSIFPFDTIGTLN